MIVENTTNAYRLLRARWSLILVVLAILFLVEVANDYIRLDRAAFSLAAVGLLVTALSIFLVFRVNEAYARWWEARGLWGRLVNSSRSFARQATTLIIAKSNDEAAQREEPALRRELVYRQIAFVNALRLSLRRQDRWDELAPFLGDEERERLAQAVNKPTQILQRQGERIAEVRAAGLLSEIGQLQMDRTLSVLHDVQGACERIKTTPFPDKVAYVTWLIAWIMAVMVAIAVTDPDNRFDLVDVVVSVASGIVVPWVVAGASCPVGPSCAEQAPKASANVTNPTIVSSGKRRPSMLPGYPRLETGNGPPRWRPISGVTIGSPIRQVSCCR